MGLVFSRLFFLNRILDVEGVLFFGTIYLPVYQDVEVAASLFCLSGRRYVCTADDQASAASA